MAWFGPHESASTGSMMVAVSSSVLLCCVLQLQCFCCLLAWRKSPSLTDDAKGNDAPPSQATISNGGWTLSWSASPSQRASVDGADLQRGPIPLAQDQRPSHGWASPPRLLSDRSPERSARTAFAEPDVVFDTRASSSRSTVQAAREPTLGAINPDVPLKEPYGEPLSQAFGTMEAEHYSLLRQSQQESTAGSLTQHELYDPESHCMSSGSASSIGNSARPRLSEYHEGLSVPERAPRQVRRLLPEERGDGTRETDQGPWWYLEPGPPSTDSEVDEDATGSVEHAASERSAPTYVRAVLRADHLRSRRAVRLMGPTPRFVEKEHARGEQLAKRMQKYAAPLASPEERASCVGQPIGMGTFSSTSSCSSNLGSSPAAGQMTWMM